MGLDITSVRYHCWLKRQGVCFRRVAMLGRQVFYGLSPVSLMHGVSRAGFQMSRMQAKAILESAEGYAEPFYRWLGAEVVDSFDYSAYENATHIWDMNESLADEFRSQYDFVFDGGTLEHVFRYSEALREAMTLVKIGGVFLSATPANSYLGHGFYQFGPDLAFAVMRSQNGYKQGGVHLIEMRHRAVFYEVLPPGEVRGRAMASTPWPAQMFFWGQREGVVPNSLLVLQPDYEAAWNGVAHQERAQASNRNRLIQMLAWLPNDMRNDLLRLIKLVYTTLGRNAFFDHKCFRANAEI